MPYLVDHEVYYDLETGLVQWRETLEDSYHEETDSSNIRYLLDHNESGAMVHSDQAVDRAQAESKSPDAFNTGQAIDTI